MDYHFAFEFGKFATDLRSPGTENYDSEYSLSHLLTQFWNITLDTVSITTYKQWCGTLSVKLDGISAIPFRNPSGLDKLLSISRQITTTNLISSHLISALHVIQACPPPPPHLYKSATSFNMRLSDN